MNKKLHLSFFKTFLLQSKPVNLSAETKYYSGGGPQIIKQYGFFQPKHKSTSRTPCILKLRGSVYLKLNPRVFTNIDSWPHQLEEKVRNK